MLLFLEVCFEFASCDVRGISDSIFRLFFSFFLSFFLSFFPFPRGGVLVEWVQAKEGRKGEQRGRGAKGACFNMPYHRSARVLLDVASRYLYLFPTLRLSFGGWVGGAVVEVGRDRGLMGSIGGGTFRRSRSRSCTSERTFRRRARPWLAVRSAHNIDIPHAIQHTHRRPHPAIAPAALSAFSWFGNLARPAAADGMYHVNYICTHPSPVSIRAQRRVCRYLCM